MSIVIKTENLTFTYPGAGQPALRDIGLEIEEGTFVGITGPTGAGKTTLAMCLNGVIPHFQTGTYTGRVMVNGLTVHYSSTAEVGRHVGSVFQDPDMQIVSSEVEEEPVFALENRGLPAEEIEKRVTEALALVGISSLRRRSTTSLSGGQKQRLAIATALALRPKILVLDEPTSELDPMGTLEVFRVLQALNRQYGMTVILIEQKTEYLAAADRLLVLEQGRIVLDDTPRNVFGRVKELRRIGVRVPEVTELAAMFPYAAPAKLPLTVGEGHRFVSNLLGRCQAFDYADH